MIMSLKIFFLHFKTFILLASFAWPSHIWGIDLKKFDAPVPERDKYLSFNAPPSLRYIPVPLAADRSNLISTDKKPTKSAPPKDSNASSKPDFPIVTYTTEPQAKSPSFIPQSAGSSLPLADPFEGVSRTNVGSTDELLNVFEDMKVDSRTVRVNAIPFIPPYTVAPDNLKIGTKATYRRVPR
jgi:hypothetical protein